MGKLGQQVERAFKIAAPSIAGLALMLERRKAPLSAIATEADRLEEAARLLREATMETKGTDNGKSARPD